MIIITSALIKLGQLLHLKMHEKCLHAISGSLQLSSTSNGYHMHPYLMLMVDTSYICEFVLFVSVVYYRLCDYLFERNVLSAVFANQLVYYNNSKIYR